MFFSEYIGMEMGEDPSESHITILPHHQNPTGNINGGVMLSLADNLSTGVANRAYHDKFGEQVFMVGVDMHASMLSNQQGGKIVARGYGGGIAYLDVSPAKVQQIVAHQAVLISQKQPPCI